MKRCLAAVLAREAVAAAGARGRDVQARSLLAPLLALSTLPTYGASVLPLSFPARECFMQLRWAAGCLPLCAWVCPRRLSLKQPGGCAR